MASRYYKRMGRCLVNLSGDEDGEICEAEIVERSPSFRYIKIDICGAGKCVWVERDVIVELLNDAKE